MSLLLPLGLIGLIGVVALIVIYIVKPNYQQKFVSSTYIWKLSLKYKKKTLPISRFRNILIFLCQILILVSCALLLARPVIAGEKEHVYSERVAIIDASASMRVSDGNATRFERAVEQARALAEETEELGGIFSLIIADDEAHFEVQRVTAENMREVYDAIDALAELGAEGCTFGSADLEGAIDFASEVLIVNPDSEVILYTATEFLEKGGVRVVDVSEDGEWNAAILDSRAEIVNNYFNIAVDVGCYGRSEAVTVTCEIYNLNGSGNNETITMQQRFTADENELTFDFNEAYLTNDCNGLKIISFDRVYISIDSNDSFADDNYYFLYGGTKEKIKIQYSTSDTANPFFRQVLYLLRENLKNKWDIELSEVKPGAAKTEVFDFYVFEHKMPEKMPEDGVVFLMDLDVAPQGSGLTLQSEGFSVDKNSTLASGETHPVMRGILPETITISNYRKITSHDGYRELMYFRGDPLVLLKDAGKTKTVVFSADIHNSNVAILYAFPMFVRNVFNYFIPFTFTKDTDDYTHPSARYAFGIGDTLELRARGDLVNVEGPELVEEFEFLDGGVVHNLALKRPGTYTVTQDTLRVEGIKEEFFVSISNYESNITKQVDALPFLERVVKYEEEDKDLLIWFASVLVGLLFVEWFLQSREYFK